MEWGNKDGPDQPGRQRSDEHTEAAAGTREQLQPEVSSPTWGLGKGTIGVKFSNRIHVSKQWIDKLKDADRTTEGSISGE